MITLRDALIGKLLPICEQRSYICDQIIYIFCGKSWWVTLSLNIL